MAPAATFGSRFLIGQKRVFVNLFTHMVGVYLASALAQEGCSQEPKPCKGRSFGCKLLPHSVVWSQDVTGPLNVRLHIPASGTVPRSSTPATRRMWRDAKEGRF